MKRILSTPLLTILLLCFALTSVSAQDTIPSLSANPKNPNSFWRRISVGGQLGFQFGTVTGIVVAPDIKIRTIDQLYAGVRLMYQYYYYRNYFTNTKTDEHYSYSSNVFGAGFYLRYYLRSLFSNFFGNFFAHAEYEYLFYTLPYVRCDYNSGGYIYGSNGYYYIPGKEYIDINSIFLGGGYSQPLGGRVFFEFMVLFNINDSYNSPYTNPVIRIGVGVGL